MRIKLFYLVYLFLYIIPRYEVKNSFITNTITIINGILILLVLPFIIMSMFLFWTISNTKLQSRSYHAQGKMDYSSSITNVRAGDFMKFNSVKENYQMLKKLSSVEELKSIKCGNCGEMVPSEHWVSNPDYSWYDLYESFNKSYNPKRYGYINVYPNNSVWEGNKRIALLLYMKGEDYLIPVKKYKLGVFMLDIVKMLVLSSLFIYLYYCLFW